MAIANEERRFPVRRIFCVGRNYAAHAREMGKDSDREPPFFFTKPAEPIFNYPYARTREALESIARNGDPDPHHGYKLRYANPATGGEAMPTIGANIQLLIKGTSTQPYRSSDATIFVGVEGSGQSRVGSETFAWRPHDVFVVPPWTPVTHSCAEDSVLFSFSDRPVQQKLGLWREDRVGS